MALVATLSALLLTSTSLRAEEVRSLRVCLLRSGPPELILEASLRIEGELRAAGFELVGTTSQGDVARADATCPKGSSELGLRAEGNNIVVSAWVPGRSSPVVQQLDGSTRSLSPEVIAVRAVEALRAAALDAVGTSSTSQVDKTWIDFAQGGGGRNSAASPAEEGMTAPSHADASNSPAAQSQTPRREVPAGPAAPKPPSEPKRLWAFGVAMGASRVATDVAALAALSTDFVTNHFAFGVRGYSSLSPERTDLPTASLLLRVYGAEARMLWVPELKGRFEIALCVTGGVGHLRLDAVEREVKDQRFQSGSHTTASGGVGGWLAYHVASDIDLRLEGWLTSWLEAPRAEIGQASIVLARPEWTITIGPVLRR